MSRKLPVYLLIDTSGSMKGEPIESVKVGLEAMLSSLRQDPFALDSVHMSIIVFDKDVKQLFPLTSLDQLKLPTITTPDSGPTHLGAALQLLCQCVDQEVQRTTKDKKGDWMPLLFVMTDGKPSDTFLYNEMIEQVKKRKFASIIACAAGMKAKVEPLQKLTSQVYALDVMDSASFMKFFTWVSASIGVGNRSIGATDDLVLPPPPAEINLVI
ncbi:VWA domain-containing protein [Akkermansia sp. N21169]|uniref:vWA domain-containing protein n=1 Tax=Akkermansia sp. N21169 TaxID=3040765 RepID=UPI00244E664F|nr:VWA domain-containing protein [Akkermansia sp. N21169]MDH3068513.1 VWA domain-containing protein [Akkermansia sp. N21169]